MSLQQVILFVLIFVFYNPAVSATDNLKILTTEFDLYNHFGHKQPAGETKTVSLNVKVGRALYPQPGEQNEIYPNYESQQIGMMRVREIPVVDNSRESVRSHGFPVYAQENYAILYKNKDVEDLARDAITIALNNAGYKVALDHGSNSTNHPIINAVVNVLWTWREPESITAGRYKFFYRMEVTFSSDTREFNELGRVVGQGYQNGGRPFNQKSWRNTALHSIGIFIENLERQIDDSYNLAQVNSNTGNSIESLSVALTKLKQMQDKGLITADEYNTLKKVVIEKYKY